MDQEEAARPDENTRGGTESPLAAMSAGYDQPDGESNIHSPLPCYEYSSHHPCHDIKPPNNN